MRPTEWFNVRDGVQYDMHLHRSRFIIVEFGLATILEAIVLLLSINFAVQMPEWPWWYWPWLIVCAGMILNSITIWLVARQIAHEQGARPPLPSHRRSERDIGLLPLMVIIPLVLPLLAWQQRDER